MNKIKTHHDRRNKGGKQPITIEFYLSRTKRIFIDVCLNLIDSRIEKKFWNEGGETTHGYVSSKHPNAIQINYRIREIIMKGTEYLEKCHVMKEPADSEHLKTLVNNFIEPADKKRSIKFIDFMLEQFELDKPSLSHGRIKLIKSVLNDFHSFHANKAIDEFNVSDIREYHNRLIKRMKPSTTLKNHKVLIKYLRRAVDLELISRNPYNLFKLPKASTKSDYLTTDELDKLRKATLPARLEKVRDIFLLQTLTGLSYADVASLKKSDIKDESGQLYIIRKREKTSELIMTPLFDEAKVLIDKYDSGKSSLVIDSIITNQKMNQYLKEIAEICDISTTLTTHLSRHTYGTLMIQKGMPIESVASALGHTSTRTTKIYAKMLSSKMTNDLRRLKITGI